MKKSMIWLMMAAIGMVFLFQSTSSAETKAYFNAYFDADGNGISEAEFFDLTGKKAGPAEEQDVESIPGGAEKPVARPDPAETKEKQPVKNEPMASSAGEPVVEPDVQPDQPPAEKPAIIPIAALDRLSGEKSIARPVEPEEPIDTEISRKKTGERQRQQVASLAVKEEHPSVSGAIKVETTHQAPHLPGQTVQPVRVVEQKISVPGSGILNVKRYEYDE